MFLGQQPQEQALVRPVVQRWLPKKRSHPSDQCQPDSAEQDVLGIEHGSRQPEMFESSVPEESRQGDTTFFESRGSALRPFSYFSTEPVPLSHRASAPLLQKNQKLLVSSFQVQGRPMQQSQVELVPEQSSRGRQPNQAQDRTAAFADWQSNDRSASMRSRGALMGGCSEGPRRPNMLGDQALQSSFRQEQRNQFSLPAELQAQPTGLLSSQSAEVRRQGALTPSKAIQDWLLEHHLNRQGNAETAQQASLGRELAGHQDCQPAFHSGEALRRLAFPQHQEDDPRNSALCQLGQTLQAWERSSASESEAYVQGMNWILIRNQSSRQRDWLMAGLHHSRKAPESALALEEATCALPEDLPEDWSPQPGERHRKIHEVASTDKHDSVLQNPLAQRKVLRLKAVKGRNTARARMRTSAVRPTFKGPKFQGRRQSWAKVFKDAGNDSSRLPKWAAQKARSPVTKSQSAALPMWGAHKIRSSSPQAEDLTSANSKVPAWQSQKPRSPKRAVPRLQLGLEASSGIQDLHRQSLSPGQDLQLEGTNSGSLRSILEVQPLTQNSEDLSYQNDDQGGAQPRAEQPKVMCLGTQDPVQTLDSRPDECCSHQESQHLPSKGLNTSRSDEAGSVTPPNLLEVTEPSKQAQACRPSSKLAEETKLSSDLGQHVAAASSGATEIGGTSSAGIPCRQASAVLHGNAIEKVCEENPVATSRRVTAACCDQIAPPDHLDRHSSPAKDQALQHCQSEDEQRSQGENTSSEQQEAPITEAELTREKSSTDAALESSQNTSEAEAARSGTENQANVKQSCGKRQPAKHSTKTSDKLSIPLQQNREAPKQGKFPEVGSLSRKQKHSAACEPKAPENLVTRLRAKQAAMTRTSPRLAGIAPAPALSGLFKLKASKLKSNANVAQSRPAAKSKPRRQAIDKAGVQTQSNTAGRTLPLVAAAQVNEVWQTNLAEVSAAGYERSEAEANNGSVLETSGTLIDRPRIISSSSTRTSPSNSSKRISTAQLGPVEASMTADPGAIPGNENTVSCPSANPPDACVESCIPSIPSTQGLLQHAEVCKEGQARFALCHSLENPDRLTAARIRCQDASNALQRITDAGLKKLMSTQAIEAPTDQNMAEVAESDKVARASSEIQQALLSQDGNTAQPMPFSQLPAPQSLGAQKSSRNSPELETEKARGPSKLSCSDQNQSAHPEQPPTSKSPLQLRHPGRVARIGGCMREQIKLATSDNARPFAEKVARDIAEAQRGSQRMHLLQARLSELVKQCSSDSRGSAQSLVHMESVESSQLQDAATLPGSSPNQEKTQAVQKLPTSIVDAALQMQRIVRTLQKTSGEQHTKKGSAPSAMSSKVFYPVTGSSYPGPSTKKGTALRNERQGWQLNVGSADFLGFKQARKRAPAKNLKTAQSEICPTVLRMPVQDRPNAAGDQPQQAALPREDSSNPAAQQRKGEQDASLARASPQQGSAQAASCTAVISHPPQPSQIQALAASAAAEMPRLQSSLPSKPANHADKQPVFSSEELQASRGSVLLDSALLQGSWNKSACDFTLNAWEKVVQQLKSQKSTQSAEKVAKAPVISSVVLEPLCLANSARNEAVPRPSLWKAPEKSDCPLLCRTQTEDPSERASEALETTANDQQPDERGWEDDTQAMASPHKRQKRTIMAYAVHAGPLQDVLEPKKQHQDQGPKEARLSCEQAHASNRGLAELLNGITEPVVYSESLPTKDRREPEAGSRNMEEPLPNPTCKGAAIGPTIQDKTLKRQRKDPRALVKPPETHVPAREQARSNATWEAKRGKIGRRRAEQIHQDEGVVRRSGRSTKRPNVLDEDFLFFADDQDDDIENLLRPSKIDEGQATIASQQLPSSKTSKRVLISCSDTSCVKRQKRERARSAPLPNVVQTAVGGISESGDDEDVMIRICSSFLRDLRKGGKTGKKAATVALNPAVSPLSGGQNLVDACKQTLASVRSSKKPTGSGPKHATFRRRRAVLGPDVLELAAGTATNASVAGANKLAILAGRRVASPLARCGARSPLRALMPCHQRYPKRVPGGHHLQSSSFRELIKRIRSNSRLFQAGGRVLRLKNYMKPDANCQMIDEVISALSVNTRVEVLYIQNYERGMLDEQLRKLTNEVLKKKKIWALNIGENFNISLDAWQEFTTALSETSVAFMYVSEHHLLRTDLKVQMKDAIRQNRKRLALADSAMNDMIKNMWFNPSAEVKRRQDLASRKIAAIAAQ